MNEYRLEPEWKANIDKVCGPDILSESKLKAHLSPSEQTYGKVCYALAFIGSVIGCIIQNKYFGDNETEKQKVKDSSLMFKSIDAILAGIPMVPLVAGSFLVAKTNSFEY